jgi:hypothetical protein
VSEGDRILYSVLSKGFASRFAQTAPPAPRGIRARQVPAERVTGSSTLAASSVKSRAVLFMLASLAAGVLSPFEMCLEECGDALPRICRGA